MAANVPRRTTAPSEEIQPISYPSIGLFSILFGFRLINALSIRTFFQPDEYFQALEPAWRLAFGEFSGAWITWEWHEGLRSAIHPLLFAGAYKAADFVSELVHASPGLRADILIAAPKVLQAALAATTDLCTYRLACKIHGSGSHAALASLYLTVFSPWQWFASVRTFANSLETTLTIVALDLWPWNWFLQSPTTKAPPSFLASLCAAAVACILRPTNILVWATTSITLILRRRSFERALMLVRNAAFVGLYVLAISVGIDFNFYKALVFPPYNFLHFNLVQNLAVFYGKNRHDYYFTEGLPLLLTTALPFAAVGIWQGLRGDQSAGKSEGQKRFVLALTVVTSVVALSLIAHKEVRFIYPLLPILHILAAKPMAAFFDPLPMPARKTRVAILVSAVAVNIFIAGYTSYVHQRGVIDVMHYLRYSHEARLLADPGSNTSIRSTVGFLMPCHSTPWRSHLIYPEIDAWALTCEPPLKLSLAEREQYMDEADVFYASPETWLRQNMDDIADATLERARLRSTAQGGMQTRRAWPEYLVFFQQLEPVMKRELEGSKYEECWRGFNTHWHDDSRRQGDVIVWCMRS